MARQRSAGSSSKRHRAGFTYSARPCSSMMRMAAGLADTAADSRRFWAWARSSSPTSSLSRRCIWFMASASRSSSSGLGGGLGSSGGLGGGFGLGLGGGLGNGWDGGLGDNLEGGLNNTAPSLAAQLQQWNEQEQRQQQQLARALAQLAEQQHA